MTVRVVNPETGVDLYPAADGYTVEPVDDTFDLFHTPPGRVVVRVTPSFRGLAYDLTSYPDTWIVPA